MMNQAEILEQFDFFRESPAAFRHEIESRVEAVRIPRGEHFYEEGARCPHFAMVGDGRIRVYKLGVSGKQITLYDVGPGQTCMMDMLCCFLDIPAAANAVIESPVEALVVPATLFRRWVHEVESMREHVLGTLARRMVHLMTLVEEVAFQQMDRRLAAHLLERFGTASSLETIVDTTHEDLALELGSAREVVSRLLEDFERRGGISLSRRRITLVDDAILREIAAR